MKKYAFSTLTVLFLGLANLFAQNHTDALRYSQIFYGGTARSIALGNSMASVGADLSCLATNPAGIGIYSSSQFNFTPGLTMSSTDAIYLGKSKNDIRYDFNLNNMGFVGSFDGSGDWEKINFGFGYIKTNDYSQDIMVDGVNNSSSILDYYIYNANNNPRYSDFRENLAYETYLMNFDDAANNGAGEYWSGVTDAKLYGEHQRRIISRKGGSGEYDFSLGANYKNQLYLGGTIGVTSLRFSQTNIYKEEDFTPVVIDGVDMDPENFKFDETLTTRGAGVNFKFGAIYQPIKFFRLGAAVHSSTFYSLSDEYKTSMYSQFYSPDDNGDSNYFWDVNPNVFDYRLRTPFRANLSAAFVLDSYKVGGIYTFPMSLSFEYEYVDYSRMWLDATSSDAFVSYNEATKEVYQAAKNLRAGYEISFGKVLLRAGYSLYGSPEVNSDLFADARKIVSGGIGVHGENAYVDFSYSVSKNPETLYMYDATPNFPQDPMGGMTEPTALLSRKSQFYNITFGLRF